MNKNKISINIKKQKTIFYKIGYFFFETKKGKIITFFTVTFTYIIETYQIMQTVVKNHNSRWLLITGALLIYTGFILRFFDYYGHERKMPPLIRTLVEWGISIASVIFAILIILGILLLGFKSIVLIKSFLF